MMMTTLYRTPDGRELPEHPTFARYHAPCGLVYVSLVTGEGKSQRFILSDLKECPLVGCAEPPPMCIYPMPAVYPQAVWLAAANYYLHSQVIHLDPIAVVKSAKMIAKAG